MIFKGTSQKNQEKLRKIEKHIKGQHIIKVQKQQRTTYHQSTKTTKDNIKKGQNIKKKLKDMMSTLSILRNGPLAVKTYLKVLFSGLKS